jgi:S-adenosylmethionine hydrolase
MIYKIVNKNLYTSDIYGNIIRRISENVSFGTFDEKTSTFLITKIDGKVELKDTYGNIIRVISSDVIEARFQSADDIIVRKKDGKNFIIDKYGNIKRQLI